MQMWKRILLHMLYPGKALTWLIPICGFSLLAAIFYNGWEQTPAAYISYVLAFYSLILVILNGVTILPKARSAYRAHRKKQICPLRRSLSSSLAVNLLYSLFLLVSGFYYHSVWFISNGIYYFILSLIRLLLVRYEKKAFACEDSLKKQLIGWNGFLSCGIWMVFLNFAMVGIVIQRIWFGQRSHYHEIMVYAIATYTFYRLTFCILHVVQQRGKHDPLEGAVRNIDLTSAMMSLYSLQVTMLNVFAGGQDQSFLFNTISGAVVCILVILGALGMVLHAHRQRKALML